MKIAIIVLAAFVAVGSAKPVINKKVCGDGESGLKVHPDCTKFYQCNNGYSEEHGCPSGLYFDEGTSSCNFKWLVDACVGGTRSPLPDLPEEPEEPSAEVPEEPQQPEEPEEPAPVDPEQPEEPVPEEPQEPEEPAPEEPAPVDGECPNKPFYYLPVASNPREFVICQNGQQTGRGKCGPGLNFNQSSQACV